MMQQITEDANSFHTAGENVDNGHRIGITPSEIQDHYNNWKTYDQDSVVVIYTGPVIVSKFVHKYLEAKPDSKILDVGAGTGRVAVELVKHGFENLDALEPSKQLFEQSENKKLYKNCVFAFLGPESVNSIKNDVYDAVTVCGAFGEGHIPCSGLNDMIRVVKPDGFIIIALREEFLYEVAEYKDRLEPYMQQLEKQGKWKRVERTQVQNYINGKTGIVYVYQVKQLD